jgi:hypothetical protein
MYVVGCHPMLLPSTLLLLQMLLLSLLLLLLLLLAHMAADVHHACSCGAVRPHAASSQHVPRPTPSAAA